MYFSPDACLAVTGVGMAGWEPQLSPLGAQMCLRSRVVTQECFHLCVLRHSTQTVKFPSLSSQIHSSSPCQSMRSSIKTICTPRPRF